VNAGPLSSRAQCPAPKVLGPATRSGRVQVQKETETHAASPGDPSASGAARSETRTAVARAEPPVPAADAPPAAPTRVPRPWVPRAAAFFCYVLGLLNILSALFPRVRRLEPLHKYGHYVPGIQVSPYAVAASLIVGMLLVSLAHALRRRKHRAWMGVVALLAASIAVHLLRSEQFAGIAMYLVFLILLIVYRGEFYALSDPKSRWRAIWTFWGMLLADVAIGLVLVSARADRIVGSAGLFDRLDHVGLGLAGISGPMHFRGDNYGDYVYFSLFGLGLLTVLVTLYLFLRPAEPAAGTGTG
jgi:lysyl-tRNA synthetase class 2